MNEPITLLEAVRYFSDPDVCLNCMVKLRWPDSIVKCPTCGSAEVRFLASRRIWECKTKHPKRQFSVKVGTIFEDSALGLDKWLAAIWMIANDKNGISSYEVHRALGVTQKTAWFMLHRIRLAMHDGSVEKLSGTVEADESFIGGKARNMHKRKRALKITGTGGSGKTIVAGLLERHNTPHSKVKASVVQDRSIDALQPLVRAHVAKGSELFTDALLSYQGLEADYRHAFINHAEKYVEGRVHTNGMENFWSLLKRALGGTYVSVEPFHLFRYLDEEAFRFNERGKDDADRFNKVAKSVTGKRLTYKKLIGAITKPGKEKA
jgi:transposase-like protein